MAELTKFDEKLGEVLGLAMAAQDATEKVRRLVDDDSIAQTLQRMHDEAVETERRCTELAGDIDGKKTAILEKARATKGEAREMMSTYLGDDADGLDGLEFLTMAEAAEVGHLEVLSALNDQVHDERVTRLLEWATPIQQRHFNDVRRCAVKLAGQEDPSET